MDTRVNVGVVGRLGAGRQRGLTGQQGRRCGLVFGRPEKSMSAHWSIRVSVRNAVKHMASETRWEDCLWSTTLK